ncbi:MAG: GreA/GreB family elongation factor [Phycisphaerales bacterium]|nr:GreA/GreB family elongation factor [Phycisphaerales bacterium]
MAERRICMTVDDMNRLGQLLLIAMGEQPDDESLRLLEQELDQAEAVRREDIPPTVVTMNTKLRMTDLATGTQRIVTLVYPEKVTSDEHVSILSPLGTVLLGYQAGDEIRRETHGGTLHLRVDEILYQPEAAGHYRL